ncbi:MAG: hypothetical protein JWP37_2705 [Mucilaginibacter sp.]|nr:hypothetical protein [Mucilaginibacter sp.]
MKKILLIVLMPLALAGCKKTSFKPKTLSGGPGAPNIAYTATNNLTVGTAVSISPVNTGGAVPTTAYGQVTTFAGSTTAQAGFMDATGTAALFNSVQQMALTASGDLYVTDANNNAIRKINPSGVVTTFAGSTAGVRGFKDGPDTSARFVYPDGIAIDAFGNFFISDFKNQSIRKITPAGVVSTFYNGLNTGGFDANGLCFDSSGNLIATTVVISQIFKISPAGVPTSIAGNNVGYINGTGTGAEFDYPSDVKMDASGNIYVADCANDAIRKITPAGVVTTFAGSDITPNPTEQFGYVNGVGTAARFYQMTGIEFAPGGVMYVADMSNNDIRRIMPDATVSLVAGSAAQMTGDADGVGTAAGFNWPDYITIDSNAGIGYISEWLGNRVRKIVLTGYSLTGTLLAGLTFDPKTGIISGTPTAVTSATTYTVTGFNTFGFSSSTFTITVN